MHANARLTIWARREVVRRHLAGVSQAEIARQMQVSRDTVGKWWRRYQARKVVALLRTLPNNGMQRSVVMGDLNDYAQHDSTSVRQVFAGAGFYELRVRLSDAQMTGDRARTHHQFGRLTPRDSRQIDAILTPR